MDSEKNKTSVKGRKSTKEREMFIKEILKFVFIFRFVFHKEVSRFVNDILGLSYAQRIIDACIKEGFLLKATVHDDVKGLVLYRKKFYYLTKKGVNYLDESVPKQIYSFRKDRHINLKVVPHNSYVIEVYFFLIQEFKNPVWISEWVLRVNAKRRVRLPDAILIVDNGKKIAIELEKTYKTAREWREILSRYRRNVKNSSCHAVLIVALESVFEGIRKRIHIEDKNLDNQHIFITSFKGLSKNRILSYEKVLSVQDICKKLGRS